MSERRNDQAAATVCHCGRTVEPRDPDPWEGRMDDYCEDCAINRCDCYPDECPVKHPQASSAANVWGTWHIETAWGWRNGEDRPELLVAWDYYSYEQNEQGFREAVAMAFADNQIRTETLRRVTLKVNGDRIMELYETPEVEAEAEASE